MNGWVDRSIDLSIYRFIQVFAIDSYITNSGRLDCIGVFRHCSTPLGSARLPKKGKYDHIPMLMTGNGTFSLFEVSVCVSEHTDSSITLIDDEYDSHERVLCWEEACKNCGASWASWVGGGGGSGLWCKIIINLENDDYPRESNPYLSNYNHPSSYPAISIIKQILAENDFQSHHASFEPANPRWLASPPLAFSVTFYFYATTSKTSQTRQPAISSISISPFLLFCLFLAY